MDFPASTGFDSPRGLELHFCSSSSCRRQKGEHKIIDIFSAGDFLGGLARLMERSAEPLKNRTICMYLLGCS